MEATLRRDQVRFLPYLTPEVMPNSAVQERSYAPASILNFGFVGRLVSTKGIEEICQLSQKPSLAMVRWHLYGEGPDYTAVDFREFPRVEFHGRYRDLEHYATILNELDAMVLLSRHSEGMPLSLIEALSAGLPWLATDRGGTREIGVDSANCVVIPIGATLGEMEASTLELVRRIRVGETSRFAQRRVYDDHFSPETVTRCWLDFFTGEPICPTSQPSQY
jgi:glycosyltransferase involved in cell wall biosynthesis